VTNEPLPDGKRPPTASVDVTPPALMAVINQVTNRPFASGEAGPKPKVFGRAPAGRRAGRRDVVVTGCDLLSRVFERRVVVGYAACGRRRPPKAACAKKTFVRAGSSSPIFQARLADGGGRAPEGTFADPRRPAAASPGFT